MNTKFFTGVGDDGVCKMGNQKISKGNSLFEVLGGLDELNSWIGFCRVEANKIEIHPVRNSPPKGPSGAPSAGEISNGVKNKNPGKLFSGVFNRFIYSEIFYVFIISYL